jgi:hypothetical protein
LIFDAFRDGAANCHIVFNATIGLVILGFAGDKLMKDTTQGEFPYASRNMFIHFDVPQHFLKLDTFVATATSTKRIVDSLNSSLYGGRLDYELLILPPEEGSFLQRIVVVLGLLTAPILFFDSDSPAAFVEGLTGKKPSDWAKDAGGLLRENILSEEESSKVGVSYRRWSDDEVCRVGAQMLVAMTRATLEMDPDDLADIADEEVDISEIIDARADFYDACIFDRQIRAIGFTPKDDFPIPRNSFPERARRTTKRDVDYDQGTWGSAIDNVSVTSPNWDQDDQETRKWKGKDSFNHTCYFVIEDENFWDLVKRRKLQVRVLDTLKVQWILQEIDGKIKNRRVLRVLEVSGAKVSQPMSFDAVLEVLKERSATTSSRRGPTLFDDLDGWHD